MRSIAMHLRTSTRMSTEEYAMSKDQCQAVMEIVNGLEGVTLKRKAGGKFHFPMYMTRGMREKNIDDLDLSVRSYNCLKRAGYNTVGELTEAISSGLSLRKIRNLGSTSAMEIMSCLFLFQYNSLPAESQYGYLMDVIRANYDYGNRF